jgi:hypothetical protein
MSTGDNRKICNKKFDKSTHMRGTRIEKEAEIYATILYIDFEQRKLPM